MVIRKTNVLPFKQEPEDVLAKLRRYLSTNEEKMGRWLHKTWNAQADAIKYQEIRDAIIAGTLSIDYVRDWQQDYSRLVIEHFGPMWLDAMEKGAADVAAKYSWRFDPASFAVTRWVEDHGGELAVNLTQTQHEAMKLVIQRAATLGEFGPDEMSRSIRPLVGMVPREAKAVQNYYLALRKDGMGPKKAQERMINYAARVHRHRAMRIARTELAFAYNYGADQAVMEAQKAGLMGRVFKVWSSAEDERVCVICGPMDGKKISQDAPFILSNGKQVMIPPGHIHCRCACAYVEEETT